MECKYCSNTFKKEDGYEIDGEWFCGDCIVVCDDCGEAMVADYDGYGYTADDRIVCDSCIDSNYSWCEDCDEVHSNDVMNQVEGGNRYVCDNCMDNYITCEDCGYIGHCDNMHYSDRDDEYYCDGCIDSHSSESKLFEYHSGKSGTDLTAGYKFRIGFEMEKEDMEVYDWIDINEILEETKWAVEEDGSLDDESGFEAVSPMLPLRIGELNKVFTHPMIKKLVEAEVSSHCGGHIAISDLNRTGEELLDDIAGYLPILYALFPHRTRNSYCEVKSKESYKEGGRDALNLGYSHNHNTKGARLEIRLFDSAKGVQDIMNRARLVRFMMLHKAETAKEAIDILSGNKYLQKIVGNHLKRYSMSEERFKKDIVHFAKVDNGRIKSKVSKLNKIIKTK